MAGRRRRAGEPGLRRAVVPGPAPRVRQPPGGRGKTPASRPRWNIGASHSSVTHRRRHDAPIALQAARDRQCSVAGACALVLISLLMAGTGPGAPGAAGPRACRQSGGRGDHGGQLRRRQRSPPPAPAEPQTDAPQRGSSAVAGGRATSADARGSHRQRSHSAGLPTSRRRQRHADAAPAHLCRCQRLRRCPCWRRPHCPLPAPIRVARVEPQPPAAPLPAVAACACPCARPVCLPPPRQPAPPPRPAPSRASPWPKPSPCSPSCCSNSKAAVGERLINLLDREARNKPGAQALSRQYDGLVDGMRPVRLSQVEFKAEPADGRLLVTGHIRSAGGRADHRVAGQEDGAARRVCVARREPW